MSGKTLDDSVIAFVPLPDDPDWLLVFFAHFFYMMAMCLCDADRTATIAGRRHACGNQMVE